MKRWCLLAAFGCACLSAAAVWLGGINQDEGWYLYAARMVSEGLVPYRDFAFTQGPVMPSVYSVFTGIWNGWGLLGGRTVTLVFGLLGIGFFVATASVLAPAGRKACAAVLAFLLLGNNLYHLYYLAMPKTYALTSLFVAVGFFLVVKALRGGTGKMPVPRMDWGHGQDARATVGGHGQDARATVTRGVMLFGAGLALALAAGTRISMGALLAVVGFGLLVAFRRLRWSFLWFGLGGMLGLAVVYGPFLIDDGARAGLVAAQQYHAGRGGFDPVFAVGSLSRLVRWYLPTFILFGVGVGRSGKIIEFSDLALTLTFLGFLAVAGLQMLAPHPYEDYQVPVMGLLAVVAVILLASPRASDDSTIRQFDNSKILLLLALGLTWACSFGSPLLEKWMTNGQDRFWTIKKGSCEMAQLRDVARRIERLDPGGTELLTQDTYLAIETGRRVPHGLEMGPFSILDDAAWRALLEGATASVAALSGYTFAVEPPKCAERPMDLQLAYWEILRKRYSLADRVEFFGQNATTLLILKRDGGAAK